jgi:hypothetical protein
MEKFLDERDRLANDRIYDLEYNHIRRDPIAAVRRIYDHFGWSLSREAEQRMRVLVARNAQRQSASHRYHLSQFGSSAQEVLSAFAPYCQRFGLSSPNGEKLSSPGRDTSFAEAQKRSRFVSFTGKNNLMGDGNFANDL